MREVRLAYAAGSALPPEAVDFMLCEEVYRCTPGELAMQDAETVELHKGFLIERQQVRKMEAEVKRQELEAQQEELKNKRKG